MLVALMKMMAHALSIPLIVISRITFMSFGIESSFNKHTVQEGKPKGCTDHTTTNTNVDNKTVPLVRIRKYINTDNTC